ncbi:MAG: hypothetical protein MN733_01385 [Nitrososphaera sp.]|nr:hypothetical protein [Nitrososphaera sp.]
MTKSLFGPIQVKYGPNEAARNYSPANWKKFWKAVPYLYEVQDIAGNNIKGYEWILGREIRISKTPEVRDEVIAHVMRGVADMFQEAGLEQFKISYHASHWSAVEQITAAILPDGSLDYQKLWTIAVSEKWRDPVQGGTPHADIYVTHLTDSYLWGASSFPHGCVTLFLPKERQANSRAIRINAKHETGHLLGYQEHHESVSVTGYNVPETCNMHHLDFALDLCDKCRDALVSIWEGIEQRFDQQFFKK